MSTAPFLHFKGNKINSDIGIYKKIFIGFIIIFVTKTHFLYIFVWNSQSNISVERRRNKPKIITIKNINITTYIVKLINFINDVILAALNIVDNLSMFDDVILQRDLWGSSKAYDINWIVSNKYKIDKVQILYCFCWDIS